jgi:uncharacterized protein with LGFP repeats
VAGSYRAGRTYAISYYPMVANAYGDNTGNQRCGTRTVTIANAATAGLYNYTPYVPNAAALQAGYGTGDSCSSYGNRNFWAYMTDWFGGPTAISDEYDALRTSGVDLGGAQGAVTCDQPRSGCKQVFDGGTIFWSPGAGAHVVRGALLADYLNRGGPGGVLGYPLTDDAQTPGANGYWNNFQYGALLWSAGTSSHMVRGAILDKYWALGGPAGPLGFPDGDDAAVPGGFTTSFTGGALYWSSGTGAHMIRGAIYDEYTTFGGPAVLGFPTADDGPTQDGGGALIPLTGGSIYWRQSDGSTHVVRGNLRDRYESLGGTAGLLGYPTGNDTAVGPGYLTSFTGGTLFWSSSTGAKMVRGALLDRYTSYGGPVVLGFPTADDGPTKDGGGALVRLTGGTIYWKQADGSTHVVRGALRDRYESLGGTAGLLGYPTGDDTAVGPGYLTSFSGGTLFWSSSTGAKMVRGALLAKYSSYGGPLVLGFPTADDGPTKDAGGALVPLTGGEIYWKQADGSTHVVRGNLRDRYESLGGTAGLLGYPTGDDTAVGVGYLTSFSGGTLFWSSGTGAKMVRGAILDRYTASGGPVVLGFPLADDGPAPGGGADVELGGGSIYWSQATGAHVVRGALRDRWLSLGGATGMLGYPTGDDTRAGSGYLTAFSGGTLFWSSSTGARYVRGAILDRYTASGGPAALGFPLADDGPAPGGGAQVLLPGAGIYWSQATGAHLVRGNLRDRWLSLGGTTGLLGYPTGDDTRAGVGYLTAFSGGTLFWSQVDGARMVRGALLDEYLAAGGPAALGFPKADDGPTGSALPGGAWVPLDDGALYWSSGTGAHLVENPAAGTYSSAAAQARLGFPITDTHETPDGARTDFQFGSLLAPSGGGAVVETDRRP